MIGHIWPLKLRILNKPPSFANSRFVSLEIKGRWPIEPRSLRKSTALTILRYVLPQIKRKWPSLNLICKPKPKSRRKPFALANLKCKRRWPSLGFRWPPKWKSSRGSIAWPNLVYVSPKFKRWTLWTSPRRPWEGDHH